MLTVSFVLQLAALVFLLMASLNKGAIWDNKLITFPLGMFLWLLSLMIAVVLHPAVR